MKSFVCPETHTRFQIGTSDRENWSLLAAADKTWWWLHLADVPSAHAILEIEVDPTPEELESVRLQILQQTKKAPSTSRLVYARVKDVGRGEVVGEIVLRRGIAFRQF